jgi:IPT/TIG domain
MVKRMGRTMMFIGTVGCLLAAGDPGLAPAADKEKSAKKPKAAPEAKAPKPKADQPKFHTAEKAATGKACFGEAPRIEKLTPDEGKAGDKVTISGTNFGSADCLRGVSFGPGHAADFKMKDGTTITVTVPKGGRKGLAMVTVTTASGEDSKPFLVK